MSTHKSRCVICGAATYCSSDENLLGAGRGQCMENEDLRIEFCSLEHFLELQENMSARLRVARDLYPDWFVTPVPDRPPETLPAIRPIRKKV